MYQETRRRESGRCTTWPVDDNSNTIPWYTALLFVLTPSGASQTRTSAAVVRFALRRCSAGISGATHTHTHTLVAARSISAAAVARLINNARCLYKRADCAAPSAVEEEKDET